MLKTQAHRGVVNDVAMRVGRLALVAAIALLPLMFATAAQAQNFQVLYTFTGGPHGADPMAGLVRDGKGNVYGMTSAGGSYEAGTLFRVNTTGKEVALYTFNGSTSGDDPVGNLLRDGAGNLYGATEYGGAGHGLVFKLHPAGSYTALYNFTGGADGEAPDAGLIRDAGGNFYGTTAGGGDLNCGGGYGCGTVFKIDATGIETVLYSFTGADGQYPEAGLVRDPAGNLYGTTALGGDLNCANGEGCGTVFELDTTGKETVLHSFTGAPDGYYPTAGLLRDAAGSLFGTTDNGGNLACTDGCGTVFKLDTTGTETVLYSFTGGVGGSYPDAGLIMDAADNLYGTTVLGGDLGCLGAFGLGGCGTVFKLNRATGKLTNGYLFTGGADGAYSYGGLIMDAAGNLYGTTSAAGDLNCAGVYGGGEGCGTVFEITP